MTKHPVAHTALLLTLMLLAHAQAQTQAQVQWKWRDASGNVQYSDRPPPLNTPDKDILLRPPGREPVVVRPVGYAASAAAVAASVAAKADTDAQAQRREAQDVTRAKDSERRAAAQRSENCKNARSQMQLLESGVRVTRTNDKGEIVVLNEAQRAEEQQRARTVAANDCR